MKNRCAMQYHTVTFLSAIMLASTLVADDTTSDLPRVVCHHGPRDG